MSNNSSFEPTFHVDRVSVRPVRTAHEQVGEQLREMIISGELSSGTKLPSEGRLAIDFGVSRPTVREALRALAGQGFVRTVKGARGGSFVQQPTIPNITDYLSTSMAMLSRSAAIQFEQFLEARILIESPAAAIAAQRRTDASLQALAATIPEDPLSLDPERQYRYNRDFHRAVVDATGNPLLTICSQPVFAVLNTHLRRSPMKMTPDYHLRMNSDHQAIFAAVRDGDSAAAETAMRDHLEYLRPRYQKAWFDYVTVESTSKSSPSSD
jgi:GntR family transcriptional repressor for pyruvate dehydrogenase complex